MLVAFDIETIPDTDGGRKLYDLEGIGTEETAKAMMAARRLKVPDSNFLPLHQHKVIAISVAVRWDDDNFVVKSLGAPDCTEKELVSEFFAGIERKLPTLISWNGSGFDLPVMQYRALIHGIQCDSYWETGEVDQRFRFSNYQSRYHQRHIDVMDMISRYQPRASASLDDIAKLLNLPGKIGIGGEHVFESYLKSEHEQIRNYCDIDALNTFLIYLRFEYIRGKYTQSQYQEEIERIRNWLLRAGETHFIEYEEVWSSNLNRGE